VFGEMPRTGGGERWDAFDQMYRKHTPRLIPPGAPSVDDCKQLLDKRQTLGMPKPEADVVEREIERCRIGMSKLQLTCALAAPTLEEMTKCDR
jgi:hypothetical protein